MYHPVKSWWKRNYQILALIIVILFMPWLADDVWLLHTESKQIRNITIDRCRVRGVGNPGAGYLCDY